MGFYHFPIRMAHRTKIIYAKHVAYDEYLLFFRGRCVGIFIHVKQRVTS
jgi:hypothetical protein